MPNNKMGILIKVRLVDLYYAIDLCHFINGVSNVEFEDEPLSKYKVSNGTRKANYCR